MDFKNLDRAIDLIELELDNRRQDLNELIKNKDEKSSTELLEEILFLNSIIKDLEQIIHRRAYIMLRDEFVNEAEDKAKKALKTFIKDRNQRKFWRDKS